MADKLTNAYALHGELSELQTTITDEKSGLTANRYAQQFFTVATWIIYLLFAAAMYAAPLWVLQAFFGANTGNYLAIVVIGVFLVVFPTALALGKHAGYRALSKRGIDPRYMGAIIAFFIASGIYFEATSASSQQQEKAHQAVENSNAGKSIMGTTISTSTGAYAAMIADAEYKLVACERKLSEGNTKDCKNSQAKVDSLKNQAAADRDAAVTANAQAIPLKQAALEKERESHALPIAKSFAELFGSSVATGAVIAALIAALIFEISHSLTIYNEWRLKSEIARLDSALKQLKVDYFHQTGKQFDATDFKEGEIIDLVEMRENGTLTHFNAKLQDAVQPEPEKKGGDFGFIKQGQVAPSSARLDAENRRKYLQEILYPTGKGKTEDDYALIPREDFKRIGKTYCEATRTGTQEFHDTLLDKPLSPSREPQAGGRNTLQLEGVRVTPQAKSMHIPDGLYEAWVSAVNGGECLPSIKQSWLWIQKRIAGNQQAKMTFNNREINAIAQAFLLRAVKDNHASINPRYTTPKCGLPKYLWSK